MKLKKYIFTIAILSAFLLGTQSCFQDMDNDPAFNYPEEPENPEPPEPEVTDPSSIAKDNLVAYFPFDGDGVEKISLLGPTTEPNTQYVEGRRGQAWQGDDNAYFLYDLPANSKIRTMKTYTAAMWVEQPQVPESQVPVPMIFQLTNSDDLTWGNIALALDRSNDNALQFKTFFRKDGVTWSGQHISYKSEIFTPSKWIHLIVNYDSQTSTYNMFVNGVKLELPEGVAKRYASDPAAGGQPLGDLNFTKADQINFGAWLPKALQGATDEWMGWFKGKLDEFRLYDKTLTSEEAKALYDAEVTNLNK